jgi:putative endonuclease
MGSSSNFETGRKGEELALKHYQDRGYSLVKQNFEYRLDNSRGRLGEIDLIFQKDGKLFLVEVKNRLSNKFGSPQEQITKQKLRFLYRAWQFFLSKFENQSYRNYLSQFDIAVVYNSEKVEIIENAYQFDGF